MLSRSLFTGREGRCRAKAQSVSRLKFESLEARLMLDSTTVFNEIMYHPADDTAPEWIELHNQMAVDMDLSGWSLSDGVEFEFASDTVIPAGGYLVISSDPAALQATTGFADALGPFVGALSNSGERLQLRDNNNRLMNEVDYNDKGNWPIAPDGSGVTLAKVNEGTASDLADNWAASASVGGTPGSGNFSLQPQVTSPLIAIDAAWKYDDSGIDLGTAWRETSFNDSLWPTGDALLFDTNAALPAAKNTPLASGRSTYYFRTEFVYGGAGAAEELRITPIIDDGAVFYLNGQEILRINMPSGEITHDTLAVTGASDATFSDTITLPIGSLVAGTNVLAVELHQSPSTSLPLTISNASFEVDAPHPLSGPTGWTATNINLSGNARVYFTESTAGLGTSLPYPKGSQALGVRSNDGQPMAISQDLGTIQEGTYSLSFAVADRTISQWLNYQVELVAVNGANVETVLISEDSAVNIAIRPVNGSTSHPESNSLAGVEGDWLDVQLQGTAGAALAGQTLRLRFTTSTRSSGDGGGSFDLALDDVVLSASGLTAITDAVFGMALAVVESLPLGGVASLALNEVAAATNAEFWLELINTSSSQIELEGVTLRLSGAVQTDYVFPQQTLAVGARLVITEATLGFVPTASDQIFLYAPGQQVVWDAAAMKNSLQARSPEGTGSWLLPNAATPGVANTFDFHDEIVINEIMYHHRPNLASPGVPGTFGTTTIVSLDALWRYNESGESLAGGWQQTAHSVAGNWQQGQGLLGFETTPQAISEPILTTLNSPTSNSPYVLTYYFETDFTLTQNELDAIDSLQIRHIIDDGAVFYLNGVEFLRPNMPSGTVTSTTLASSAVSDATLSNSVTIPKDQLVAGVNRLSVEVHQIAQGSFDIIFGAELSVAVQLTPGIPDQPYSENSEEWIELYNRSNTIIDLSGWELDDAVRYEFPLGTTLAPGEYLVVAKDSAALQAKYPSLTNVVGNFSGSLSNNDENILLLDNVGNPADEVHYYEAGRWDRYADGDGSSLELRDPDSDNARGEAWAASDEASQATWQTYTYRGIAAATIPGEPSLWRELAVGFLDGFGEALIDDVSVVHNPDGAATELIQNGSFNDSDNHWRLLGNHQRSEVIDDGGNSVLYLKSSGAAEYQGNQIETTLTTAIQNGQEYEISFRAKWLAGSRQINSRLYFNRLPKTTFLDVPNLNGTPGRQNSQFTTNVGPTFDALQHSPVTPEPNAPVTISVMAEDPDNVATMTLWYRTSGGSWASVAMAGGSAGSYSAAIPGQAANTVVQFYVEGTDTLGASALFPREGADSRALFEVNDGQDNTGALHSFRVIMMQADSNHLFTSTNTLSNELLGGTVVYNGESFYDVGVRLKGSFVGRNAARVGFNIGFNPEQLFRGVHDKVAVDRSTHAVLGVDEILIKHIANRAGGIPSMFDDLAHFIGPGASHTGTASLRMAAFDSVYLDSQFENGSDGTVYEYEVIRWATTTVDGNPESLKRAGGLGDPNGFAFVSIQDLGEDKEAYRWNTLITSNRTRDDYGSVIAIGKAFSSSGAESEAATAAAMDIDQWMRTTAYQSLVGPGDSNFGSDSGHNFRLYARASDGKILFLPWDWDSMFSRGTSSSLIGGGKVGQIINMSANRRVYYGHMLDIVDTSFNTAYMSPWTTHYGSLAGQNFSGRLSYIGSRAAFVTSQINATFPSIPFAISTTSPAVVNDAVATIDGKGWVNVREIRLAGSSEPLDVTWNTSGGSNADTWTVALPVPFGSQPYTFEAYDFQGNLIGSETITINSTVSDRPIQDFLRITEVMYNPDGSDSREFIELLNMSGTEVLDLTGVTISISADIDFTFSAGTSLAIGDRILVVRDQAAFEAEYGTGHNIAGVYSGVLANEGETIIVANAVGAVVQQFAYQDGRDPLTEADWHPETDGEGFSLVVIEVSADYSVGTNWRSSAMLTGSPGEIDPQPLLGNFNGDLNVDRGDIVRLLSNFGRVGDSHRGLGDANGDRATTLIDLALLQSGLGSTHALPSPAPLASIAAVDTQLDRIPQQRSDATAIRAGRKTPAKRLARAIVDVVVADPSFTRSLRANRSHRPSRVRTHRAHEEAISTLNDKPIVLYSLD